MSKPDRRNIKLTAINTRSLSLLSKSNPLKPSIAALANRAIIEGIPALARKLHTTIKQ